MNLIILFQISMKSFRKRCKAHKGCASVINVCKNVFLK